MQFLHAEGKGPPLASLRSPTYRRVAEQIQLHKTKTDDLIDLYYAGRLEQQQQVRICYPFVEKEINFGEFFYVQLSALRGSNGVVLSVDQLDLIWYFDDCRGRYLV